MNTNLVMVSVLTMVGINEAEEYHANKKLTMEPVVAGFIVGIFLFALDEVAPPVAKGLAILVMVGTVLKHADSLSKIMSTHL